MSRASVKLSQVESLMNAERATHVSPGDDSTLDDRLWAHTKVGGRPQDQISEFADGNVSQYVREAVSDGAEGLMKVRINAYEVDRLRRTG